MVNNKNLSCEQSFTNSKLQPLLSPPNWLTLAYDYRTGAGLAKDAFIILKFEMVETMETM